jgi:type IV pilus assembly protein PilM
MLEFLSLKNDAFGLDISDFSLKIARLKRKGRNFELASFGEFSIPSGVIKEGEISDEKSLVKILKDSFLKALGEKIRTRNVIASLPEEKAFLQIIELPFMKEEEIVRAIGYQIENYIPLPVEEVYWDCSPVGPLKSHSEKIYVLIAAMPKKIVDPYFSVLRQAGLKPLAFEIESGAIARTLIPRQANKEQVLVIDLGATKTGFAVSVGTSLACIFSIPVSGIVFDQIITKELGVNLEEAERLKMRYGLDQKSEVRVKDGIRRKLEKGRVFEALIPCLTDLLEQIEKYLNYYYTHVVGEKNKNGTIGKVIVCGGGAYIRGLPEFLSKQLKIPVELGNPWVNILPPVQKKRKYFLERPLRYATVFGLALRGIGEN